MSNLVEHAEFELKRAGLFDSDSDYGGMLGPHILHLVKEFAKEGHSGGSAAITIAALTRLLRYKPLTAITNNPEEWFDVSEASGLPMWQNKRDPSCFSRDGGETWYSLDDLDQKT